MARTGRAERLFRASPFHHCASVPPAAAGMIIQACVPWLQGSRAGGPDVTRRRGIGRSGRILSASLDAQLLLFRWSSTTYAPNTTNAWNVNLNDGNVNLNNKTNTNFVWPVPDTPERPACGTAKTVVSHPFAWTHTHDSPGGILGDGDGAGDCPWRRQFERLGTPHDLAQTFSPQSHAQG
jgi:hypothetical protein